MQREPVQITFLSRRLERSLEQERTENCHDGSSEDQNDSFLEADPSMVLSKPRSSVHVMCNSLAKKVRQTDVCPTRAGGWRAAPQISMSGIVLLVGQDLGLSDLI